MKRQNNLSLYTSADLSPSLLPGIRFSKEEPYSQASSPNEYEVTDDLHELLMRQGIVFFKNRALERMKQIPETH